MRAVGLLGSVGLLPVALVGWIGGRAAAIGGGVALGAQLVAVALLRPGMDAPQREFLARWIGGMALRGAAAGALIAVAATHRLVLPLLPATLGFLGVLLPLLFVETRFLK